MKAHGVLHEKTATQHLADLYSLKDKAEMDVCFEGKNTDCVRGDGGPNEGPGHLQVQFRWTEWHLKEKRELTVGTTRNSGANLFMPSTLCESAETETPEVKSQQKLKKPHRRYTG